MQPINCVRMGTIASVVSLGCLGPNPALRLRLFDYRLQSQKYLAHWTY